MIITEILAFRCVQARNLIKREVWGRLDIACLSWCKTSHFLLPAGGGMIITEYWPLDVFKPGLL